MILIWLSFVALYLLFMWKSGRTYPLMYFLLFAYFIQYIFSVYLSYNSYPVLGREMPLSQGELFDYAFPALFFLFAGVFIFNRDIDIRPYLKKIDPVEAANLGHLLLAVSFFFDLLLAIGVPGITPIVSFTYFLKFSGGMCYLFSPSMQNYSLFGLVYLMLTKDALTGGVFIDFLTWLSYLFLLVVHKFNLSFSVRSSAILIITPLIIIIQTVKDDYRKATWYGSGETGVELFTKLAKKKQEDENDPFQKSKGVVKTVGRLNQGWHLGKVLVHVPAKEPFSYGEDFITDMEGVLLPRMFFPDKKVIGSQAKFKKFTGHRLRGHTSMTIGVIGDFYVNFGVWGSYAALFLFGAGSALLFKWFIVKYVLPDPINIVWIPFIFNYLARAGNDFYVIANAMLKGFLIFLIVSYIRRQFWPDQSQSRRDVVDKV
jgi:hypothetical protein